MCEVLSFPASSSTSNLSYTELLQLSNMAGCGLPTNLLFCKSCQTIFKDPKLLPCLHTYCHVCLQKQLDKEDRITCSLCGYFMSSPEAGVSGLTNNVFAERVVKQYINKIQDFATSESENGSIESDRQIVNTLLEKAKYSPASLSMYLLQKRDNSSSHLFSNPETNMMSSPSDDNSNLSRKISEQPDLVQSHTSTHNALHNIIDKVSNNMDHKLMTLQGEALRVTYGIDSINQSVNDWRENRYQLKRKVEERSNILQHQIKRHEKRLVADIDSRCYENKMMKDAEKSKHTLRQNLKGILQTVEFLKQVQDYATEEEVMALKDRLMLCSVNISEVQIKWQEFQMEIPSESPDVLMASNFGQLQNCEKSSVIFIPGSLEVERDLEEENRKSLNDSMFTDRVFSYSKSPPLSRRISRLSQRVSQTSETDDNASDVTVSVDEFRNMRESFKQKRRQLLEGHSEDFGYFKESLTAPLVNTKKKRVRSFGGNSSTYLLGQNDALLESQLLNYNQPLPPNATSRDITERNEICQQMAHLSQEDREDKNKRMQNLRESWRRRKEVLMKNDGYISPDSNKPATFDYDVTDAVEDVPDEPQSTVKQSRMKLIKNRFSQMRHHFRNDATGLPSKADTTVTDGVILRNKPHKEKRDRHWSGIFRTKESKRRSLSAGASTEYVLEEDPGSNDHFQKSDVETDDEINDKLPNGNSTTGKGLTRTKLQQIRTSVRNKTQRWRSFSSN